MARQAKFGEKLSKAWKAARQPLDLDTTNQILMTIQLALLTYRTKNRDDQDQLPRIEVGLDVIKFGSNEKQTKGSGIAIHGVSRFSRNKTIYGFCSGKNMEELDKIQSTLVFLTGPRHKDAIEKLVIEARNRVYAGNPVTRFVKKFQNPGPEIAA